MGDQLLQMFTTPFAVSVRLEKGIQGSTWQPISLGEGRVDASNDGTTQIALPWCKGVLFRESQGS